MTPMGARAVLFAGLVCVSTSGPFFVMSGMDPYAVVLLRMGLSAPILLGAAALRGELRVARGSTRRIVLGALLLVGHFVLWVKAFELTNYASNLLLLVAQPVMAAVVAVRRGERRATGLVPSIALALLGLGVIAGGDFALGGRALLGDALCIVAGAAITFFYVVTEKARAETPITTLMGICFAIGAVVVTPLVWLAGVPVVDYPIASWGWLAALVLITTIVGHSLMNIAARYVELFTLNIVIVLEPAIAIGLGALLFETAILPPTLIGGAFLIASVVLGLRRSTS